jgi:subfamily B ATP-binding cassette protein MsbA
MTTSGDSTRGTTLPLVGRLWRDWVRPYRRLLALNLGLIAVVAATTAAYPVLIRWALDRFERADFAALAWLPVLAVAVTAAKGAALFGHMAITNLVASRVVRDLQGALFERLVGADLLALGRDAPAALAQRFTTDLAYVQTMVARVSTSLVRDVLMLAALLAAMLWMDWRLTLAGLVVLPLAAWPVAEVGRRLRTVARRTQERTGAMSSIVSESLAGARTVKSYGLEAHVGRRARDAFEQLHALRVRAANQFASVEPILEALGGLMVAGVLVLVGWRLAGGGSTVGDFAGFVTALLIAAQPMRSLGNVNAALQEGLAATERAFEMLDREPSIRDAPAASPLRVERGEIAFEDVGFVFPDGARALDRVSFRVPGGRTVALVGRSGSGKSTLFNLVPRLYDPTEGRVTIDGQDVRDVTLASLRSSIALVSQDVVLFDDTVAANIGFGRPGATREEIVAAARVAAADAFVARLAQGYDTRLGPDGVALSGGERQRLALARAVLRDAPILLLDEATSALDAESEHLVQEALAGLAAGHTTLVIAHRLATVRAADLIVVLDHGRVAETGTHAELLARDGVYAGLHRLQFRDA